MALAVYLAARFSRRDELAGYADELEAMGIHCTSRWLRGQHEWLYRDHEMPPNVARDFAVEDMDDIDAADVFVLFPEGGSTRGGMHWEAGYAYGRGDALLLIVGPRTDNIFYQLGHWNWAADWEVAKVWLADLAARRKEVA